MKSYAPTKASIYISYIDMNNFYGRAMSSYLPYGGFKWSRNADNFDVNAISKNSSIEYILNVDLKYPDELHVLQSDYPLAPEKRAITYDILSNYCKRIADEDEIKVGEVMKLIPNLGNKTNYVLHNRNLQWYLSLGMKLTKIHRMLKFKQYNQMKKYIDFNTKKGANAANSFERDFFKLVINSVYCKTMENLRKRINVRLVNNEKEIEQQTNLYYS